MVGLLRFRFAAGVCVLAAGLLMGAGGAVAVADPGSNGSAALGDHKTNPSGQQQSTGANKPKHEPGATTSGTGATTSGTPPTTGTATTTDTAATTTTATGATTTSGTGATTTSGTGATTTS